MNIPDTLASLLDRVPPENVLDFSLGSAGSYYIRYLVDGQEKRSKISPAKVLRPGAEPRFALELSKYLWEEIDQDHNLELDRLTLGPDGQHWGVRVDRDGHRRAFGQVDYSRAFYRHLYTRINDVGSLTRSILLHLVLTVTGHSGPTVALSTVEAICSGIASPRVEKAGKKSWYVL